MPESRPSGFRCGTILLDSHIWGSPGFEKNIRSAYYWLRVAEESASALQSRCHELAEEIKPKLSPSEIGVLETNVELAATNKRALDGEYSIEAVHQHLELLPL